jgi:hypothetical protein
MSLYLNKLRHSKYKKIYIDSIKLIAYILGDSSQYRQSKLYFSNNNQKIIHNIIMKYSVFWPK